jgi:DNA-dependent RNA polymerase auxiliary subunit epsilon
MTSTLTFQDDPRSSTKNLYQEIRKNSATHDTFNRLHSIQYDIGFVRKVSEEWYHGQFKVVANQRCGSWYTDPTVSRWLDAQRSQLGQLDD